jgi:hypothetical protein
MELPASSIAYGHLSFRVVSSAKESDESTRSNFFAAFETGGALMTGTSDG